MIFHRKNKEIEYFNYSLDKKVDFYYDILIRNMNSKDSKLLSFEDSIKTIIFNELDSFELVYGRFQIKKDKESLGIKRLHSDLGHLTGDWTIDWAWILHHIILDFQNVGIALNLLAESKTDSIKVYKYLPLKYYDFAERIYLKDGLTKEPKIFELKELMINGHGLKENQKEFNPIVGVTLWSGFSNEYWDLTELNKFDDDDYWDIEEKRFKAKPYERKIKRNSKVKITIGDKKYEI